MICSARGEEGEEGEEGDSGDCRKFQGPARPLRAGRAACGWWGLLWVLWVLLAPVGVAAGLLPSPFNHFRHLRMAAEVKTTQLHREDQIPKDVAGG